MKRIAVLMMLVVGMNTFAERLDNKDHEIGNGIFNEMQEQKTDNVSKTKDKKELDAGTKEVIKEQMDYEMLDKEDGIGRD